jgi:dihydroorotate dehydrogenase (NAD+) catalytic subunit
MPADLAVQVAGLPLKSPVMAGSGEATMDAEGLLAAIDAGAAAVVAKSTNESDAAGHQLEAAEYALLDEDWRPLPLDPSERGGPAPRSASLFCRSGLQRMPFDAWVAVLTDADRHARDRQAYVIPSLVVADPSESVRMAKELEAAGLRWLELNVGAPHSGEAAPGTIRAASDAGAVAELVRPVRSAVDIPLTVKLGGQGDPVAAAKAARDAGADAVCIAGRTLGFLPDLQTRRPVLSTFGAVGGAWALPLTLRWVAKARLALGRRVPLIGTNGARDGRDVARFLLAGASAVEMTSAVIVDGFEALSRAIDGLRAYLDEQRRSASDIIGEATDHVETYEERGARSGREPG